MCVEPGSRVISAWQRQETLPVEMSTLELEHLFASCMPRLQRMARRILRNPQDSDDALQEGLLLAYSKLGQFQGRSNFCTWLHSIVRNAALTHVRRMRSRPLCPPEPELSDETDCWHEQLFVDSGLGPEEECMRRERSRILREVVENLPSRYRFAMRLYYYDGVDLKDAAQEIGITPCALKTHLFRARRLAVRRMREKCLTPGERHSGNEPLALEQTSGSVFLREEKSVHGTKHANRGQDCLDSRADKKLDFVGGTHESKGDKSPFWKRNLPTSVHRTLPSAHQPAC